MGSNRPQWFTTSVFFVVDGGLIYIYSRICLSGHLKRISKNCSSVVEWLKHRAYDQHGPGSKPTCAILLCPWERHFTALFPACGLGKQI